MDKVRSKAITIPPYCGYCEQEFTDEDEIAILGYPHYTYVHRDNCLMRYAEENCTIRERLTIFGIYATLKSLARMGGYPDGA